MYLFFSRKPFPASIWRCKGTNKQRLVRYYMFQNCYYFPAAD